MTRISTSYRRCTSPLPTNLCNISSREKGISSEISNCGSYNRNSEAASGVNSKHAASQTSTSIPMLFTSPCNYSILYIYYLIEQQSPRNNGSKVAPSRTTSWILFTSRTRHAAVARGLASRLRLKHNASSSRYISSGVARGLASRLRLKHEVLGGLHK